MYKIQDICIKPIIGDDKLRELYYRCNGNVFSTEDGLIILPPHKGYDLFTYFNALSVEKWCKYTWAKAFGLILDIEGDFDITLFGHYIENDVIKKENLGFYHYEIAERKMICLMFPQNIKSQVVSFILETESKVYIHDSYYAAEIEKVSDNTPYISLVTTTYKKEKYVCDNIDYLKRELFADPEFCGKFCWNIVDNGQTLEEKNNEYIKILSNKNVGGAGGFARGMLESINQEKKPTHIILMDDDVIVSAESFKRLYRLLSIMKPEYANHFISGAMLELENKNIQHEDVGYFSHKGVHGPAKERYDLNVWDSVIRNEEIIKHKDNQYAGWWFCCIPTTIVRSDNLPMPCFFRGDDVEYSIRNDARFITLNGICIWHQGFGGKYSAAVELYQVHRNDLILQSWNVTAQKINVIGRMQELFWQEIFKFNYKGANLILDAIDDYLKGPEYLRQLDGSTCMKEKKEKDNKVFPIDEELRKKVKKENLYEWKALNKIKKYAYDHSCNGQKRVYSFWGAKETGIIPYGWGYYQKKMFFCKRIIAVDIQNDCYAIYEKNTKEFKKVSKRYHKVMKAYMDNHEAIQNKWKEAKEELVSSSFWNNYLFS